MFGHGCLAPWVFGLPDFDGVVGAGVVGDAGVVVLGAVGVAAEDPLVEVVPDVVVALGAAFAPAMPAAAPPLARAPATIVAPSNLDICMI